uniref:Uncharacterized protein n=1 Tax=Rangifer tarandus platyrhynchus TaxID=3082113 RepID=A0ACB0EGU4_RANTA|nr:unnamed protein product [Rangifer tarandus platyrhynchus]
MRRHAPRVIRKVSPSSKAPGGAPSSHPPAPYLANLSRGPRASTPASAPNSAKRRCGHRAVCASSLWDPGVRSSYSTESLVAPPPQTPPARRRATPNGSPGTAARPRDLAKAPPPGLPAAVVLSGERLPGCNLESRISLF